MPYSKYIKFSLVLCFLLITCLIYWSGLSGAFLFDDFPHIVDNPALQLTTLNAASFMQAVYGLDIGPIGRPLSNLSFAINSFFHGTQSAFYFKLTNLIIHLINGILLFIVTYKITPYFLSEQQKESNNYTFSIALVCAGLWLIHPFNLTTVLYVIQRMNSLATLFILLTLINYILIREKFHFWTLGKKILSGLSLFLFFLFGILSKENAVLVIFYVFLVEAFCFKFDFKHINLFRLSDKQIRISYYSLILITVICFTILLIKFSLNYSFREFTLAERLMTESRVILFYARLILIPDITQMGLFHDDFILSKSILSPISTLFSLLFIGGCIIGAIIFHNRFSALSFGIALYLCSHALESTTIPLELIHEHRNYFSSFSLIYILVFYFLTNNIIRPKLKFSIIIILTLSLSTLTFTRSHAWGSTLSFATWLSQHHPQSSRSLLTSGSLLLASEKPSDQEQGFALVVKAQQLSPHKITPTVALINTMYLLEIAVPEELINQLMKNGKQGFLTPGTNAVMLAPSKQCNSDNQCVWPDTVYEKFLQNILQNPTLRKSAKCRVYTNLASIKSRQEKLDDSISYAGKALECDPDSAQNHLNYANLLIYKGDTQTSLQHIIIAKMLDKSEQNQRRVKQHLKLIQNPSN